jgi:hypothetical protein
MTQPDRHATSKELAELAAAMHQEADLERPMTVTHEFAAHMLSLSLSVRSLEEALQGALQALAPKGDGADVIRLDLARSRKSRFQPAVIGQPGGDVA